MKNNDGWKSVEHEPPAVGVLCAVYFPVGVIVRSGETTGPVALAYKTSGGWKMADEPSPLRGLLGEVGPAYWKEFSL